jgi:HAE1 family hydrophobic/amphiphilic exporter-1
MAVRKQSGANTVEVVRRVLDEVEQINRDFPQARLAPFFDTSDYIQRSISNVSRSLLYGSGLAVLVLLAFLGNPRATLVIATAIPVSLIATFALVYFNGFTINLMTLGGLALGVGLMVDSAIVVLENIMRRRDELNEGTRESAVAGTGEIGAAIIASTLTTLAIFVPMLFARELAGQLFRQLAVVVAFALVCALLVALTVVPMLTARAVRSTRAPETPRLRRLFAAAGAAFETLQRRYRRWLDAALARPRTVLAGAGLAFAAALATLPLLGTEFMPATDEGEVRVSLEMPPGTRLEVMDRQARRAEAVVRRTVPEAASVVASVGAGSHRASAGAEADLRVELVPLSQRGRTSGEVAAALREAIGALPDTTVRVRVRQPFFLRVLQGGGAESLQVEVRGYAFETIDELAEQVAEHIRGIPGVTDVRLPRTGGEPQRLVIVDRERAADLGVSVEDVGRTVETAIAGGTAGYFLDEGDEVRIVVKLADNLNVTPAEIMELPVPAADGRRVRLGNVAELVEARGPTVIDRKNQQRLKTVYVNIAGRDLGSVAADVQAALDEIARPTNYDLILSGEYEEQVETFREMGLNVLLALLLVYMVMACLYESLRDPLIVMTTVPMALIGVVLALLVTGTTLNAQSLVGCLMLIGIVVNNAILIVDQANLLRREGRSVPEAVREAGRRRLRPILMTATTTMLALLPLAIGLGEGSESQAPLARAVIGGLLSSTLITLIVIPVTYAGFHGGWPRRHDSRRPETQA